MMGQNEKQQYQSKLDQESNGAMNGQKRDTHGH